MQVFISFFIYSLLFKLNYIDLKPTNVFSGNDGHFKLSDIRLVDN